MISYTNYDKIKRESTPFLIDEAGHFEFPRGKSLTIGKLWIHWQSGSFWFRFFNIGLKGTNLKKNPYRRFSLRNGYKKTFKIFNWEFENI